MSCVNTSSNEFKETMTRLNVSKENLETIVHDVQNSLEDENYFPSDQEILERLHGTSFKASKDQLELYKIKGLDKPMEFGSYAAAVDKVNELRQWFPAEAIRSYKNARGIYEVHVASPYQSIEQEMQSIKDKAIADGTFMKAPNGNDTNLTEQQWLQVRTKSFIDWFGDWINNSAEASKVVDENGEPLVVYHGSPNTWTVYDETLFGSNTDEGYYGRGLYLSSVENKAAQYGNTMSLFVNIRNPIRTGMDKNITMSEAVNNVKIAENFNRNGKSSEYDGVLYSGQEGIYEEIVVPTANQIKSATSNNGEFSTDNDNIYKQEELSQESKIKLRSKNTWTELVKEQPALESLSEKEAQTVQDKLEEHIKEEATKAIHRSTYTKYFDTVNEYGYSFSTVGETLDNIINSTDDADVKTLAEFAKKYVNDKVSKFSITYSNKSDKTERGRYKASDDKIIIHRNAASGRNAGEAKANFEKVMLHEIIHAITVDYITSNVEAKKEIASIMNQLDNAIKSGDKNLKVYALKNTAEFIAEFMSKPTLREALKLIPYQEVGTKKPKSMFQKIMEVIKNALSKLTGKSKQDKTLYDKAMESLTRIMEKSYSYQDVETLNNPLKGNTENADNSSSVYRQESASNKPKTIEYIPIGKERQPYTIEGNKIFNKNGVEVFASDSKDRRKIFANLAVREGRAVVVDFNGMKYVVNNKGKILSTATGNFVWENTPENGNRKAILEIARQKFGNVSETKEGAKFVNHSGGAKGSDSYWGEIGEKYGVSSNHYYVDGNKTPTGNTPITQNKANEADEHLKKANEKLGRAFPTSNNYVNNLLRRNWQQVSNADAIFAVGHLVKGIVDGGTGWAVQMAIDNGKPVYVFDQERNQWYKNIEGKWSTSDVPKLTPNFAGIGTRALNDNGKRAIEEVYAKTFNKQLPQSMTQAKVEKFKGNWNRNDVSNDVETLYIFTDNTDRDSGKRLIPNDSWYAKKYGEGHHFPTMTAAVIRGLDNARPISTQRWYHNGAKGETGRWTDDAFDEFKKVIDDEFDEIIKEWNTGKYKRVMFPDGDGLFNTHISNISKERIPKIYDYLQSKYNELLNIINSSNLSSTQTTTQTQERINIYAGTEAPVIQPEQGIDPFLEEYNSKREVNMTEAESDAIGTTEQDIITINQDKKKGMTKENESFRKKSSELSKQIDTLYNSSIMTATEIRHIAEQVVYWVSDRISEIIAKPEKAAEFFGEKFRDVDFSNMTRLEVINKVGIDNLIELCKRNVFDSKGKAAEAYENFDTSDKADLIYDNFDAVTFLAIDTFSEIEKININKSADGKVTEVTEDTNIDEDNFNQSNDPDVVKDIEGNETEHWQVETKTLDVMSSMSQEVRRALTQLYKINSEGEKVTSEFGIYERVDSREATNSILRWIQGAVTLDQMIDKLRAQASDNPWVNQLIDKLTDKREVDFQSQFFSALCKHFQPYSVIYYNKKTGKNVTYIVNESPALKEALNSVIMQYKLGEHPMFTSKGINKEAYNTFGNLSSELSKLAMKKVLEEVDMETATETITTMSHILGYPISPEMLEGVITPSNIKQIAEAAGFIVRTLSENMEKESYDPFNFNGKTGIRGNVRAFLQPITEKLEVTALSAIYDSGKMYQSYITPSYTTKMFQKLGKNSVDSDKYIMEQWGKYSWNKVQDRNKKNIKMGWRDGLWIGQLAKDAAARNLFSHKVQLSYTNSRGQRKNYMKNMDDMEYAMSVLSEFFIADTEETKQSKVAAWYHIPMLSNKPSSEFIQFYREIGDNYKDTLTNGFLSILMQELDRIQTVETRNFSKKDPRHIKNFDVRGRQFCFLDFMNDYLITKDSEGKEVLPKNGKTELARLIRDFLDGKDIDAVRLNTLAKEVIKGFMEQKATNIIATWKGSGIVDAAESIEHIGEDIEESLRNFIWNDTFASMNILEMLVGDVAFYKDAEELQKRLAQVHAPGVRGNINATDYGEYDAEGNMIREPKPVSDGIFRTVKLTDWDTFISNIIENVSIIFDRKIAAAPTDEKAGLRALKESLVRKEVRDANGKVIVEAGSFRKINVADAQGYSCPTSYRKKALIFGKWSKQSEEVWKRLREGTYTYSDLMIAFQPLKPFVYSQIEKSTGVEGTNMNALSVPIQFKNSEYLLVMADALLRNEDTGRPNLLRALYDVMEESHFDEDGNYSTKGIDTIQFESTTKSGLSGKIDLTDLLDDVRNGEALAKARLEAAIYEQEEVKDVSVDPETGDVKESSYYKRTGNYNLNTVDEVPMEDYTLQQEIPDHFKNHEQAHGSQGRYINISELEALDADGKEILYTINDPVTGDREVSAKEFKEEYERTCAENIEESIEELRAELGLDTHDVKERNIAISKILQREILSSPRYGVDLLLACSLDENDNFRIPLGDPVQSKRIEQLLNSVIKNRVNKQKIAGGPVVQVSNFGTTKELNIKFKDKNGGLLMTRPEWEASSNKQHDTFEDYIKENQGGIAYFEVFAPIYTKDIFKQFANDDGTIDIETIELIDPDLLKMIGYRIPTEDKYSSAPLKIVGFLPREAGDGIMLPNDITLLSGSDFDIDKMYLMLKEIVLATRFTPKESETMSEAEEDYFKHNKKSIRKHLISAINLQGKTTAKERAEIERTVKGKYDVDRRTQERYHNERLDKIESRAVQIDEANDNAVFSNNAEKDDAIHDKKNEKADKAYEKAIEKENKRHQTELDKIQSREDSEILKEIEKLEKAKVEKRITEFLEVDKHRSAKYDDDLTREIRKAYLDYMYKVMVPTSGRAYRNNKIVDMTYEVLTHETSADKVLNPGGFDPQKKMGYMVEAHKRTGIEWETLDKMPIKKLKDLCNKDKNLSYVDTHVQFYKQNSAAASLIGIFAVNRIAHAVLESGSETGESIYYVDVKSSCGTTEPFTIAGLKFNEFMPLDPRFDNKGQLIGKVLGSLVGASADAVKDPVLNLMNINSSTSNYLNTLIRLGMNFDDAALFLSQATMSDILWEFSKKNLEGFASIRKIVEKRYKNMVKALNIDSTSPLWHEELTREELIKGLTNKEPNIVFKYLLALGRVIELSESIKMPTFATRFNSISSAVGPQIVDNLITEHKMWKLNEESKIVVRNPDDSYEPVTTDHIFKAHPILDKFKDAYYIAQQLFGNMPTNSRTFRSILNSAPEVTREAIYSDRTILSDFSDFFQSYLLVENGVIDMKDLNYFINEFPKEFNKKDYKEKYANNAFIQGIKYVEDERTGKPILKLDTNGMDTKRKEAYSSAWIDLHKQDHELSTKLFKYCFFKGGIGFSPKTFMSLVPVYVKEHIEGYTDTYRTLPSVDRELVLDQFIAHNCDNYRLVPFIKLAEDAEFYKHLEKSNRAIVKDPQSLMELEDNTYFKTSVGSSTVAFKVIAKGDKFAIVEVMKPLGNNGEYMEMSTSEVHKPITETTDISVEKDRDSFIEPSPIEAVDTPATKNRKMSEKELDDLLYQVYNGREDIINKVKSLPESDKRTIEKSTKKFIENRFKTLNLTYDESLIDDVFKRLC